MKIVSRFAKLKKITVAAKGESMLPLLKNGDMLNIRKVNFNSIKINDVVLVKKRKQFFSHRVIYKQHKYLITKGDNNKCSDGRIYSKNVIGKVYQVKRGNQFFHVEDNYLFQSTLYFQEIIKLKKALDKEKIDFLFLKGLPLHLFYEHTYPHRLYFDCDILIYKTSLKKIKDILKNYHYKIGVDFLSEGNKILKDKEIEITFYKILKFGESKLIIVFDVHVEPVFLMTQIGKLNYLYPQKLIDQLTNKFLREKRCVKMYGETFPILSQDNLIVYLALHFFHHNYKGIFRLSFLHRVISNIHKNNRVNIYAQVLKTVIDFNLKNFVWASFILVKKYYNVSLSLSFVRLIKPEAKTFQYIEKKILNQSIFDEESRINEGVLRFKNLFFLSPIKMSRKILTFFNPQVIYSIFFTFLRKIKYKSTIQ